MRRFTLTVPDDMDGRDIKFIMRNYFHLSERMITRLKYASGIMLNNKPEYVTKTVHTGDFLVLTPPCEASQNIIPVNLPLNIIYEDDDILAVDKPRGMPTHPSLHHFDDTLANAVRYYYREIPFTFRAISRLDSCTSGVVVIAKNAVAADKLCRTMREGAFEKEYFAICCGKPEYPSGTIDAPIRRESEGIIKRCIAQDGKYAVTDYSVTETDGKHSLLRLIPHTGRTHQLRLHLAHIGCPIYGDFMYGSEHSGDRLRLHCRRVCFPHPFSGARLEITAPMPEDMRLASVT